MQSLGKILSIKPSCLIFLEYYSCVYNTTETTGLGQLYCYLLYIGYHLLEIVVSTYPFSCVERATPN